MDIDDASDEQMDMLMMMQMDKLSELCGGYTDLSDVFNSSYCGGGGGGGGGSSGGGSNNMGTRIPNFLENSHETYMDLPTSNISFNQDQQRSSHKKNSVAAMREMIFRIAAMQPINIDPESVKPPKRRNVKISKDPQSVAARLRRERISEKIRILQRLVPGGTKMDTASMLDEAIHYVKFLKTQVQSLQRAETNGNRPATGLLGLPVAMANGGGYGPVLKSYPNYTNI